MILLTFIFASFMHGHMYLRDFLYHLLDSCKREGMQCEVDAVVVVALSGDNRVTMSRHFPWAYILGTT